ncbi:MAG: hypothetical protein Q4G53_08885 [Clostridia bacterium]|nr:hypothetical protein [Clostridia bacterium]
MKEFEKELKELGMTCLGVGQKFDGKILGEGAVFDTDEYFNFCYIFLDTPSEREIKAVSSGKITITLRLEDEIIYFHMEANGILDFLAPFNMCLYDSFRLAKPDNQSYIMPIILVDTKTKIIKALRVIGYDNRFSQKLYELAHKQWVNGVPDFNGKINKTANCVDANTIGKVCASLTAQNRTVETEIYD